MNKAQTRQEEIRFLLNTTEKISTEDLAEYFSVTTATIRSDIREMEEKGEVNRRKGLVSLVRPFVVDIATKEKIFVNASQKSRIAARAAQMVLPGDFVMMTSGTTIEAMASQMQPKENLEVITPSIVVAFMLAQKGGIGINILGGKLQMSSMSVRDNYSLKGLENIYCSKLFLGCDGFDLATGVFTASIEEARLTQAMMDASHQTILLADSTKLRKTSLGRICKIQDIDILITDSDIPEKTKEMLEDAGIRVEIV